MKKNIFFAISFFSFFAAALFAEVTVVNPVPGNFANAQTLVIEANDGEEIYYSFSGTDPLASGFAYDGPVLLDVTGNVELRVAVISKELSHSEIVIRYAVSPAETKNPEHAEFLSAFESVPIFEYVAGEKISIPFTLEYAFGSNRIFERGREVSISKNATVERFLPISLRSGSSEWRYVVHIMPSGFGKLSRREVPFEIVDWTTLVFTDQKKIYSLDGSWWHSANEFVSIDRSVENTVYYQSADYSPENPVTKIV
ncbi:MAG: chitobiase/beta-hexosaminidase C-terminal domain-containing protein, partial [Treponemataceae bacterium]|nr:chitobiase/beta-hexosaminidase C-terminal domain-containing protein [Treponemataceae bacterium]